MGKYEVLQKVIDDYIAAGGEPAIVLDYLSEACQATTEHVRSNWQDNNLAKQWESIAKKIDNLSGKLASMYNSR